MHLPESFKLDKIYASGVGEHTAAKIVLSYSNGDKSFLVIEEKTEMQNGFDNFKKIDINGTTGYLKPGTAGEGDNTDTMDTDPHWFKNETHYSVMGLISEDEAVKIARSMK
jgi:hypothetical protein